MSDKVVYLATPDSHPMKEETMSHYSPHSYRDLAEFEREVLRDNRKAGWSLDDLYNEASFNPGRDDSIYHEEEGELDFDFA